VGIQDQAVATEWVRRYGAGDRVQFYRGDPGNLTQALAGQRFGMAFVDTEHDAPSVRRDLEMVLALLEPEGLVAVHGYPDPGWPDVRRVVDEYVIRCGWERVVQADYLGLFQTRDSHLRKTDSKQEKRLLPEPGREEATAGNKDPEKAVETSARRETG
jgi:hypothetical protein